MENTDLNNITPKERIILQEVIRKMRNADSRNLTNPEKESTFTNKLKAERVSNNIPMINQDEMELLRFCHERDMRKFLREEFTNNPIDYSKLANDPTWMV